MITKQNQAVIGIIVALIAGSMAGYFYGISPIAGYQEEIQNLNTENFLFKNQIEQLHVDLASFQAEVESLTLNLTASRVTVESLNGELEDQHVELENLQISFSELEIEYILLQSNYGEIEGQFAELQSVHVELQDAFNVLLMDFEILNQSYSDLLSFYDDTLLDNFAQTIDYNISAGTDRIRELAIPQYGIIWEARIRFSGDYVEMSHAWRRGGERYFVGSSGRSLTYRDSPDIVYYGIQQYLWGNITVEYYTSSYEENQILVKGTTISNLPTIMREATAHIDAYDPSIDGFAQSGEWPPFENMLLVYDVTFLHSIRSEESAWDKDGKAMRVSAFSDEFNLYVCAVFPDDYLSEDFQIDGIHLYINNEYETQIMWTTDGSYRINSWSTNGAVTAQYSHTSGGDYGVDGLYTVELVFPLYGMNVNSISIHFFEVTKFTSEGTFETSSYWAGAPYYD
jgi:hypothetical protein